MTLYFKCKKEEIKTIKGWHLLGLFVFIYYIFSICEMKCRVIQLGSCGRHAAFWSISFTILRMFPVLTFFNLSAQSAYICRLAAKGNWVRFYSSTCADRLNVKSALKHPKILKIINICMFFILYVSKENFASLNYQYFWDPFKESKILNSLHIQFFCNFSMSIFISMRSMCVVCYVCTPSNCFLLHALFKN